MPRQRRKKSVITALVPYQQNNRKQICTQAFMQPRCAVTCTLAPHKVCTKLHVLILRSEKRRNATLTHQALAIDDWIKGAGRGGSTAFWPCSLQNWLEMTSLHYAVMFWGRTESVRNLNKAEIHLNICKTSIDPLQEKLKTNSDNILTTFWLLGLVVITYYWSFVLDDHWSKNI